MTYIVVEGPVGVGKTVLTRLLGEHMALPTVFEQFEENSFLTYLTLYADQESASAYRSLRS
jgi:deoxyadenosine/deoxycytidine kinase